jgi:HlyD family secretion protein
MHERARIIPLAVLILAIIGGTWWWATTIGRESGVLTASGTIEAEEITIAAEIGGRVVELLADKGDEIRAGDPLLRLDQEELLAQRDAAEANLAQAKAAVEGAGAQLALAQAGAHPDEIAAAEGGVASALGSVAAAEAALAQAELSAAIARDTQGAESAVEAARAGLAQAQGNLAAVEANVSAAQGLLWASAEQRDLVAAGASESEIASARAWVAQAELEWTQARDAHDKTMECFTTPGGDQVCPALGTLEEQARFRLTAAEENLEAARAQLDRLLAGPDEDQLGAANAQVSTAAAQVTGAQAQVSIAEAAVRAAEAQLAQAEAALGTAGRQAALAEAGVAAAQAQIEVARGGLAQAEARRDRLQAGATAEEIAALEAQVDQAEAAFASAGAALRRLEIQLARTTLEAPVDGLLLQRLIHLGELVTPGAPLFTLADLDELTITVYVPEDRYGEIRLGQAAILTVDSFPGQAFPATVEHIADQAEFTPRNVQTAEGRATTVFAIELAISGGQGKLKPGMPADVRFEE